MLNKIKKSNFIKNVFIMMGGAAGAQLVALLASPLITRLYGPEAFGVMGTFAAIANILIPVAALTYPIAIVLPKKDNEAKDIMQLSLFISISISLFIFVLLITCKKSVINIFNIHIIEPYLLFIPLIIVFTGLLQIIEQWLIRTEQFKINAKVHFIQSIIVNGSKVSIGYFYPVAIVLVLFQVFGNGIRAFMMIFLTRNLYKNLLSLIKFDKLSLLTTAKKYKDFPVFRAPEVFISATTQNLPILILTAFTGPAAAGLYSIGRTVLALPARLVGESVGDVFYPRVVKAYHFNENVNSLLLKATLLLALIGIIPFGLIIFIGPTLFEFVFGEEWNKAGEYARWIALTSYATFIARPCVKSLPVFNAQRLLLIITIMILITQTLSLFIGFYFHGSDMIAIAFFGISGFVMNLILIYVTIRISRNNK